MSFRATRVVRARKLYGCWDCERLIRPGELHLSSALAPGSEPYYVNRWLHGRFCRSCCERYGFERQLWQEAMAAA